MSKPLAKIIASRFIQRRDVKAVQLRDGKWTPDNRIRNTEIHGLGFSMPSLLRHLDGKATYGHYLLDAESHCRVFVFDIDLEKAGYWVKYPTEDVSNEEFDERTEIIPCNPRELWLDRSASDARAWFKLQMRDLAQRFAKATTEIGVPCATAYSGSKGVHVYGFTGNLPAPEVREAADIVMELVGGFEPTRGDNFYKHTNPDPVRGFTNFSIEVFPKQSSLEGKSLGNLVRLPLGRNQKSKDPTFFLDLKAPMAELRPHPDPIELLESGDAYA